ncbi:MAG: lamin tail domain-containing protein, partial [Deltaproteobacteria bacterium]|nr:lamin tail domain-containing protein [Deltaproteobacteria bacterium]
MRLFSIAAVAFLLLISIASCGSGRSVGDDVQDIPEVSIDLEQIDVLYELEEKVEGTTDLKDLEKFEEIKEEAESFEEEEDVPEEEVQTACPQAGSVIITEFLFNPKAVGDTYGEYFEIYNTTDKAIDVSGWMKKDLGKDKHQIGKSPLVIEPKSYLLLARNADPLLNGDIVPDYVYKSFSLSNDEDEIILLCEENVIDQVAYNVKNHWPKKEGKSTSLDPAGYDHILNDDPAYWCSAIPPFGAGDFGTPDAPNNECDGTTCGDAFKQAWEPCDDGNKIDGDGCDMGCLPSSDKDADGVYDIPDNCPDVYNPDQTDSDDDGVGDECDSPDCGNMVPEGGEECDDGNDVIGDGCEPGCKLSADGDDDGIFNSIDNCPDVYNPAQEDTDADGAGDLCDPADCGNGFEEEGEDCDDGNTDDGDGCSALCALEDFIYGDVIVTEIMYNPAAVSDSDGEWFELYNTTGDAININGWVIRDSKSNYHKINKDGGLWIEGNYFLVLGTKGDPLVNGGVEVGYDYSNFTLGNTVDDISLFWNGVLIDSVQYDSGVNFPAANGASLNLSADSFTSDGNDIASNWCLSDAAYGSGDKGSPGEENFQCPPPPPECGNNVPEQGEECDDGNSIPLDGCEPDCTVSKDSDNDGVYDFYDNCPLIPNQDQADADFDGKGDACDSPECGNGFPEADEECDDGNAMSGDGCSKICKTENFFVGSVIITEIMFNPAAVLDSAGEYFEVYNTTDAPVDMSGWILKDDNTDSFTIVEFILPAKSFAVFGIKGDALINGGVDVDVVYKKFYLANGSDSIVILWNDIEIDRVNYDYGVQFPQANGASLNLTPSAYDHIKNDAGPNWCLSTSPLAGGDKGNPGAASDPCLCDPNPCFQPPGDFCKDDGETAVLFPVEGACTVVNNTASCSYMPDEVFCPDLDSDFICFGGDCVFDECLIVNCDQPPQNACKDQYTLLEYPGTGVCVMTGIDETDCIYTPSEVPCGENRKCENGECVDKPDPCKDVVCSSPPQNYCDGNILVSYQSPGTCVTLTETTYECQYQKVETDCGDDYKLCVSAQCVAPKDDDSNWDFEDWTLTNPPEDFTQSSGITSSQETVIMNNGFSSAKLGWKTAADPDFTQRWKIPVLIGKKYTFHVWARDNDPAGKGRNGILFYKGDGTFIVSNYNTNYTSDGGDYRELAVTASNSNAALGYALGRFKVYDESAAWDGDAELFIDDWAFTISAPFNVSDGTLDSFTESSPQNAPLIAGNPANSMTP